jgi:hypothetical protein
MEAVLFIAGIVIYTYTLLTLIALFQVKQQAEVYTHVKTATGKGLAGRTVLEEKAVEKQELLSKPHLLALRYFKK